MSMTFDSYDTLFDTGAQPAKADYFSSNVSLSVIIAGNFNCTGNEESLLDCLYTKTPSCGKAEAVGVVCEPNCTEGELRLADGNTPYEGRVELCMGGLWGTVCDKSWSTRDSEVICKQMNLSKIGEVIKI